MDYTEGLEVVVEGIQRALTSANAGPVMHAFDAISGGDSIHVLSKVLVPEAHATFVRPEGDYTSIPATIRTSLTYVGVAHVGQFDPGSDNGIRHQPKGDGIQFGFVFSRYIGHLLSVGRFSGHPYQAVPGGLSGLQTALQDLRAGKASATKYVIRVSEAA